MQNALKLWDAIYLPQELGLPPFVYDVYTTVIHPLSQELGRGVDRTEIQKKFVAVYHNQLPDWKLRKEYLPMLQASGVIYEEEDPIDKRKRLIFPVLDPVQNGGSHPHSPIVSRLKEGIVDKEPPPVASASSEASEDNLFEESEGEDL